MRCPHCDAVIRLFSKALNKWGRVKECPCCQKKIKLSSSVKSYVLFFIPASITHVLFLKPYLAALSIDGGSFALFWYVMVLLLTFRLVDAEDDFDIVSRRF